MKGLSRPAVSEVIAGCPRVGVGVGGAAVGDGGRRVAVGGRGVAVGFRKLGVTVDTPNGAEQANRIAAIAIAVTCLLMGD
jgi:hypothetical protein